MLHFKLDYPVEMIYLKIYDQIGSVFVNFVGYRIVFSRNVLLQKSVVFTRLNVPFYREHCG